MTTKQVIAKLVNDICKEHNASKADVQEIVGIVCDAVMGPSGDKVLIAICDNGQARKASKAKRKAQSKVFLASKRKKK